MSLPNFSLEGKVGLVTGGSRGLGRAMALTFAEAGADIAISDIDPSELGRTTKEVVSLGRRSLAIQADISKKADVDSMVDKTLKEFGTIDILVNNAAITIIRPLLEYTEDEWDRLLDVDLKGYFLCTQAIARVMMPKKRGVIINMSSQRAIRADPNQGAYSIVKAGVHMLTKTTAVALAPYNIRVNAIGPGGAKTRFSEDVWKNPELLKKFEATVPLGRMAETTDIVGAALFLASDASSYMTGQTIYVDGGVLAAA